MFVDKRTRKGTFLRQIDTIVDWQPIEKEINNIYRRGYSVDGRPSYSGLLLFKMLLLQTWYNLSDEKVEDMVNDSLSTMRFCGLVLEDSVPDHSTLSRFRSDLTRKRAFDRLLRKINGQLEAKRIMVKEGAAMVDASLTDTPRRPKGKTTYEVAEDRQEDERPQEQKDGEQRTMKLVRVKQPGVDAEGRWVKKGGKLHFGFKKHVSVDQEGLVLAVHTTTANEHDSKGFSRVVRKTPMSKMKDGVFADKGFKVPDNDSYLKEKGIKNRIQRKAYRNRPLTEREKKFNKLISKQRYKVERTFGGMVRWFGAGVARYVGLQKAHAQHVIQAVAYNLYRSPGIIVSNCII
jgi:IS5 family transposase